MQTCSPPAQKGKKKQEDISMYLMTKRRGWTISIVQETHVKGDTALALLYHLATMISYPPFMYPQAVSHRQTQIWRFEVSSNHFSQVIQIITYPSLAHLVVKQGWVWNNYFFHWFLCFSKVCVHGCVCVCTHVCVCAQRVCVCMCS